MKVAQENGVNTIKKPVVKRSGKRTSGPHAQGHTRALWRCLDIRVCRVETSRTFDLDAAEEDGWNME